MGTSNRRTKRREMASAILKRNREMVAAQAAQSDPPHPVWFVCPHGIECDYVYTTTTIQGEHYVTGGQFWHNKDERCTAASA